MMPSRLPQTTILLVHPDYTAPSAVICSLLGDEVKTRSLGNQANIVRVVTVDPNAFLQADNPLVPLKWRCHEQQLPSNRWITHLGAPDGVYPLSDLHRAIVGIDTHDDGGMADGLILCCGGRHILGMLQMVAGALEKVSKKSPPFVIGFTGSFRSLDWLARRVRWGPLSRSIALCGFVSPLWYCRVVQPGLVLMVSTTTNSQPAQLFARPSSAERSCRKLWNSILQATKSKRIDRLPPQVSTNGAAMLYSQLQDASIIMLPCLLVARSSPTRIGSLILGMVKDFYAVFHHLMDHIPEWREVALQDNLLFDLVGSRPCVEWTNNSAMEILERVSADQAPLRHQRLLEFWMTRQAQYQWHLSTSSSPLDDEEIDNSSEPSVQNTLVDDALSHGLLMVLGIAQLMGLQMEQELSTTLNVVRQLQYLQGKIFVEVHGEGIVWNNNQLVDALTPRAHGLSNLEKLLSFVSRDPTEGYKRHWSASQSRM
jgi:hypothetical protein